MTITSMRKTARLSATFTMPGAQLPQHLSTRIVTNSFPTVQNNFTGPGISMAGRFSQTLSPTLLNEAFLSYANSTIWLTDRNGQNGSTFLPQRP